MFLCKGLNVGVFDEEPVRNTQLDKLVFSFEFRKSDSQHYVWTINRLYSEFQDFHSRLVRSFRKTNSFNDLPAGINFINSSFDEKLHELEDYLKLICEKVELYSSPLFNEFIEVSLMSFTGKLKRKEGYILKRTGGVVINERRCLNCTKYCKRFQKRWLIVEDNMVAYMTNNTRMALHEVLMFKGRFEIEFGEETGYIDGITIITQRREFVFRTGSIMRRNEWVSAITEAYNSSEWNTGEILYNSSFPVRQNNSVKWFVDACYYFNEVYECLKKAKKEVFISDWWLSPELFLKRPAKKFHDSQVVEVLGSLADRGVKVYVHLYKEVKFALTLNSLHTKNKLQERNPNINVVRHPHRSVVGGEFLWSHHEKLVCIDEEICFIGGIDLCYGRMDTNSHLLTDTHGFWNGIDYSNVRIADFTNVQDWERDIIDRNLYPRLPWHDIGLKAIGRVAADIALHFIELWNHVMTDITGEYRKHKVMLSPKLVVPGTIRIIEEEKEQFEEDSQEDPFTDSPEENKDSIEWRTSYSFNVQFHSTVKPIQKERKVETFQRIDIGRLENQLISSEESEESRTNIPPPPNLQPSYSENPLLKLQSVVLGDPESRPSDFGTFGVRFNSFTSRNQIEEREELERVDEEKIQAELEADLEEGEEAWARNLILPEMKSPGETGTCECQVVRSAGLWSLGLRNTEHSVHSAFISLIDQADHFIYIENQFFISGTAGSIVHNEIAEALVERIKVAAEKREEFKVIVVMPLLPAFEGAVDDSAAAVLRVELHWEYQTICRSPNSIFSELLEDPNIPDPHEYISFYGLRTHGVIGETPVSEIVYVHSKLMIIDDDIALIGSANINDRSELGKNDSEIAMVVKDSDKVKTILAGKEREVGKFARSLRMNLFKEFLGTNNEELIGDPLSKSFCEHLISVAANNTGIYKVVFRCYPDDEIGTIREIDDFIEEARLDDYSRMIGGVKGTIVEFPLNFLWEEDLRISIFHKEFYLPDENFV